MISKACGKRRCKPTLSCQRIFPGACNFSCWPALESAFSVTRVTFEQSVNHAKLASGWYLDATRGAQLPESVFAEPNELCGGHSTSLATVGGGPLELVGEIGRTRDKSVTDVRARWAHPEAFLHRICERRTTQLDTNPLPPVRRRSEKQRMGAGKI